MFGHDCRITHIETKECYTDPINEFIVVHASKLLPKRKQLTEMHISVWKTVTEIVEHIFKERQRLYTHPHLQWRPSNSQKTCKEIVSHSHFLRALKWHHITHHHQLHFKQRQANPTLISFCKSQLKLCHDVVLCCKVLLSPWGSKSIITDVWGRRPSRRLPMFSSKSVFSHGCAQVQTRHQESRSSEHSHPDIFKLVW